MSQKTIKNYSSSRLLSSIKLGLFACLFMPLIVSGKFIFPYIFPKQAFFQIVVEIVFVLYLFLAFKDPSFRPRSSWLWRALLAYFVVMILSSVFGVNAYHSFWSNYERMAGVVSLFHYLGFLFVAVNVFKTKQDWYSFFDFSIIASFLEALYALGQITGFFASSGGTRFDGTIGNASFLAGYMLINAFFALWLFLEKKSVGWRSFYGIVVLLNLVVMYETQTRGAMVALVAAIFVLFLFFVFAGKKDLAQLPFSDARRFKKYALAVFAVIFLFGGLIWFGRDSSFIKNNPTLNRVTHISMSEGTAQTRLLAWKMSWQGFKARPIFGWGPENYYVVFNRYYDPQLYPMESWFDRAHNAFIDILINTGLVGFLAYLAAVILSFWYLWSAWKREKIKYHTAVIFSVILIAYAIQNLFVFDTQVTLLMFYSVLAFMVWLSFSPAPEQKGVAVRPNIFFILLVALVAAFSIYSINIKPGLAGATGIAAIESLRSGNAEESLVKFNEAVDIGSFGLPEVAMRVQDIAVGLIQNQSASADIRREFTELAVDSMQRSLEKEPLNVRFMMILANIYLASVSSNNSYLTDVDVLLQTATDLSPTKPELYFYVGQVRMFQGRGEDALALFKRAVELNDSVPLSHWNYGIIALGTGQKELGEGEIKKAREIGHSFDPSDIKQIINAYTKTSDWQRIISLYQEWIDLFSNDAAAYAGLAAVYAQTGDKLKARDLALEAAAIDANYKDQADQFIKDLGL